MGSRQPRTGEYNKCTPQISRPVQSNQQHCTAAQQPSPTPYPQNQRSTHRQARKIRQIHKRPRVFKIVYSLPKPGQPHRRNTHTHATTCHQPSNNDMRASHYCAIGGRKKTKTCSGVYTRRVCKSTETEPGNASAMCGRRQKHRGNMGTPLWPFEPERHARY